MPTLDRTHYASANGLERGAYILADLGGKPQVILMASGTEVSLIATAGEQLAQKGVAVRLVSFPSWDLFEKQPRAYREAVLPPTLKKRIAVEAGIRQGWEQYIGEGGIFIGMSSFGASAPASVLYKEFGITVDAIIAATVQLSGKEPQ